MQNLWEQQHRLEQPRRSGASPWGGIVLRSRPIVFRGSPRTHRKTKQEDRRQKVPMPHEASSRGNRSISIVKKDRRRGEQRNNWDPCEGALFHVYVKEPDLVREVRTRSAVEKQILDDTCEPRQRRRERGCSNLPLQVKRKRSPTRSGSTGKLASRDNGLNILAQSKTDYHHDYRNDYHPSY